MSSSTLLKLWPIISKLKFSQFKKKEAKVGINEIGVSINILWKKFEI